MAKSQDILAVLRGLQLVVRAGIKEEEQEIQKFWNNSSVRTFLNESVDSITSKLRNPEDVLKVTSDGVERFATITTGINQFMRYSPKEQADEDKEIVIRQLETIKEPSQRSGKTVVQDISKPSSSYEIKLSSEDKNLLKKLDIQYMEQTQVENASPAELQPEKLEKPIIIPPIKTPSKPTVQPHHKSLQKQLNPAAKERTVPSSRIGRMVSFGSLAAGLGIGTAAEYARRTFGIKQSQGQGETWDSMFLTKANTERIVNTLCKVRGAALKIGQILSIQDESVISPHLAKAFERVRRSADFMPTWQLEKVLNSELGSDWKSKFLEFNMKPFAAASIGQVHAAKTLDGKDVAIKIQYPGVAKGITSDIDNLVGIMKLWNMFPEGMFIDNLVVVAKRELAWEVDYVREAECTRKFKKLLDPYPEFYVPSVYDDLSTSQVFTTDMLDGIPVEQCFEMNAAVRKDIAEKLMKLSIIEILDLQYMQTDPNWANFLYNPKTKQVLLLDFGASREYSKPFMDTYVRIIRAASENDRKTVLLLSRELGFLTGYETQVMEEAHVDAVMILGEMFQCDGEFDFSAQDTTRRIQNLVPTMLAHRLCPPPEEIYSLHRKLSGVFLLCSKLKIPINCRTMFLKMYNQYKFD